MTRSRRMLASMLHRAPLAILALSALACVGPDGAMGPRGADGATYFSVSWVSLPLSLSLSDPRLPSTITRDRHYGTSPGTYTFAYTASNNARWTGSYTLRYDPGKAGTAGSKGGAFGKRGKDGSPGANGSDFYYTLNLFGTGPTIARTAAREATPGFIMKESTEPQATPGEVGVQEITEGPWQVVLRFERGPDLSEAERSLSGRSPGARLTRN